MRYLPVGAVVRGRVPLVSDRNEHYFWEGYRSALLDLRVALAGVGPNAGWTQTADVEALIMLCDQRLDALPQGADDIPFSDEPHIRATDPHGGNGGKGKRFPTTTSYTAVPVDGEVVVVKAGLPGDHFAPDQAEGFAELLKRCAARARLPLEVQP